MCALPVFSKPQVRSFTDEIDARGFVRVPQYIAPEDLQRMQAFVLDAVSRSGNQYVDFRSAESVAGSGLDELSQSAELTALLHAMFTSGTGQAPLAQEPYQVLRCIAGDSGRKHSYVFHYDSYVITALVPIVIPTTGMAGDLLLFPNTRGFRKSYTWNVLDKLVLKAGPVQRLLRTAAMRGWGGATRITMVPGDLYLFWGYRSIHTNEPCDPDKVRSTALFHYGNPHEGQTLPLSGMAGRLRRMLPA